MVGNRESGIGNRGRQGREYEGMRDGAVIKSRFHDIITTPAS